MFRSIHFASLFARRLRVFYLEPLFSKIREGCSRLLQITSASSQTASPIRQREELFVSEISFSNLSLSLSFRHVSPYVFPVRCYSKAQATTISIITRLLLGVIWRSPTKAPQLAPVHTPASRTNPNEARQFRVEFNKSRARAPLRNGLRGTTFGIRPSSILSRAPAFDAVSRKDRRLTSIHIGYRPYRKMRLQLSH
jgi:hypothetical protein